jgi:hypothetical protein
MLKLSQWKGFVTDREDPRLRADVKMAQIPFGGSISDRRGFSTEAEFLLKLPKRFLLRITSVNYSL